MNFASPFWNKPRKGDTMKTASGLEYIEIEAGTGEQAVAGKTVRVHYTGKFPDGKVFDSSYSRGEPIEFELGAGRVIKGWDEGIALLKVGGKAQLVIPPELAYGERGAGGVIPPNATLVFDVELVEANG
jgi:FKBP-type peptidyl-prolyl cis-trans isomerase